LKPLVVKKFTHNNTHTVNNGDGSNSGSVIVYYNNSLAPVDKENKGLIYVNARSEEGKTPTKPNPRYFNPFETEKEFICSFIG
jgi:hypothetical protein